MTQTVELQQLIDQLLQTAGVQQNENLVRQLVDTSLGLGRDPASRLNMKISAAALQEMRAAFNIFERFAEVPKVSIFGSARTALDDPTAEQAETVARRMADLGWMSVTGAGPGIMEAAARGAGPQKALGVSIRLPFEEEPSEVHANGNQHVAMKYFFTRKLMLVKESRGFVCLPGGFGTLDETFELLTLQQTGKMIPAPIVLLDRPGGTFWHGLQKYVTEELEAGGLITKGDLDRVLITESVDAAITEITTFWRNYHSIRWIDNTLVFRLRNDPTEAEITQLNEQFGPLLESGQFQRTAAHPLEIKDMDVPDLPRIKAVFAKRKVGELHRVIRTLNNFKTPAVSLD
ncbi:TIGR00730 family Rossman fold protein [Canibacter zhoujuaniae]|uniref:LOG family protein n=1 Tax=Canibacter zhoujuaniae TaxID=2708343 RepID=UPI00141DB3C7|nr:TIGR00730 family Rossman fold protein [Canibacter zhoujuaniae]